MKDSKGKETELDIEKNGKVIVWHWIRSEHPQGTKTEKKKTRKKYRDAGERGNRRNNKRNYWVQDKNHCPPRGEMDRQWKKDREIHIALSGDRSKVKMA